MIAAYHQHALAFKKAARTSRGELQTHAAWIISLNINNQIGYGEASPLKGLSIDDQPNFEPHLVSIIQAINMGIHPLETDLDSFPSIRFALETALAGVKNKHPFIIEENEFAKGEGIPINGLVWMNDPETMYQDALTRIHEGYTCLKFKIGAHDFDDECRMLERIRKIHYASKIVIRLDANGAFHADDAVQKLRELSRFHIHSVEQPVAAGQHDLCEAICSLSPIKIALDEELIGVNVWENGTRLLRKIKPAYLILKPTLIGGFSPADEWIRLANKQETKWWATSALESNIGLNAIAQWCMKYKPTIPQGLGTGSLYTNNIPSPLKITDGKLYYDPTTNWQMPF